MEVQLAVLPGDGIGPEIVAEAVKVLRAVACRFRHRFEMEEYPVGGAAYDRCGDCLPDETLAACKSADAILLGAVGGPKWDRLPVPQRPERRALLTLRAELGLFANLRPAKVWNALNIGLPILECPAAAAAIAAGDEVRVDFAAGRIEDLTTGRVFSAEPFPPFMQELIAAGGLANYLGNR